MITDDELYRLAVVLGSVAMILIVVYHFFEFNAVNEDDVAQAKAAAAKQTPIKAASTPSGKQGGPTR